VTALDARPRSIPIAVDDQRVDTRNALQMPERPPEIARRYASAEAALFGTPKRHALTPPAAQPKSVEAAEPPADLLDNRPRTGRVLPSLKPVEDPLAAMAAERKRARVTALSARGGGRSQQPRQTRVTALSRKPATPVQGTLDFHMPEPEAPWPDDAQIQARKPEPVAETLPPEALKPTPTEKVSTALHRKPPIASPEVAKTASRRKLASETAGLDKAAPRVPEVKITLPEAPVQAATIAAPLVPERAFKYNRAIQQQTRRYARTMTAEQMQGVLKPHERWKMRIPTRLW
jgi:hypothetical protein